MHSFFYIWRNAVEHLKFEIYWIQSVFSSQEIMLTFEYINIPTTTLAHKYTHWHTLHIL